MKGIFWQIVLLGFGIALLQNKNGTIERFNQPELINEAIAIVPHVIDFRDTIPNDTLFEHVNVNHEPIYFSRKIQTGVCIKGECRLVSINLFWTITGKYMGFELSRGEYLSRTEHSPFFPNDYNRLHVLMNNALSPLAQYSIEELVPNETDSTKNKVDAVSSATIAAVLDHIVEGAVYTTYTLWHIVYGQTKREIEKLTSENLNKQMVMRLLNSEEIDNQVWALNHISDQIEMDAEIVNKIMDYISGDDIYLVERSLNALKKEVLAEETIQIQLASVFHSSNFLQQRLILDKLKEAPLIHPSLIHQLSNKLGTVNGTLVKSMLELFASHQIQDEMVIEESVMLLKNKNRYIANQALKYLENIDSLENGAKRKVEKYKKTK